MKKHCLLLFIVFQLFVIDSYNQVNPNQIALTIVDSQSKPISFAHIRLLNKNLGTISNERGYFILNTGLTKTSDSIVISHIGYSNDTVSLTNCMSPDTIMLYNCSVILNEVTVDPLDAHEIIILAKNRIMKNYLQNSFMLKSFYRSKQFVNDSLNEIVEAQVDIYRKGYGLYKKKKLNSKNLHSSYFYVNKGRYNRIKDYRWNSHINIVGQFGKLNFTDPIETASANYIFGDKNTKDFEFVIDSTIVFNNKLIWVISYDYLKKIPYVLKGQIFIQQSDYAIIKINFLEESGDKAIDKIHIPGYNVQIERYFVEFNFTKFENKWVILNKSTNIKYNITTRNGLYNVDHNDFLVTQDIILNVEPDSKCFNNNGNKLTSQDFLKKYFPSFWNDNNYIPL